MKEISHIKIGVKKYAIQRPMEIVEVGGEFFGTIDFRKEEIQVANKLPQHDKNQVFMHEMLHGICSRFAILGLNQDEQTIDLLATGLYEAIIDNPHIFHMENI